MRKKKKDNSKTISAAIKRVLGDTIPSPSDIRKTIHAALKGNTRAKYALRLRGDEFANIVNTNMEQLEKEGYNYGNAYMLYEQFTDNIMSLGKFSTTKELQKDWVAIGEQLMVASKIMSYKDSTVAGQRAIEVKRISTLRKMGVFPKNYSIKNARKFLSFLGREETKEILGEYGNSQEILPKLYKAYTNRKNTVEKLSKAFNEYLSQRGKKNGYDFYDMMEKLGVTL